MAALGKSRWIISWLSRATLAAPTSEVCICTSACSHTCLVPTMLVPHAALPCRAWLHAASTGLSQMAAQDLLAKAEQESNEVKEEIKDLKQEIKDLKKGRSKDA